MKLLVAAIFALFSVALATENEIPNFNMDEELTPEEWAQLKELVEQEKKLHESVKFGEEVQDININVNLNEYLDRFLVNVRNQIINNGLDPTGLPDQKIDIKIGSTTLTEGQLNDTSSIERYEDITLTYNSESKRLVAEMVLRFQDLKFIFKYHTKVVLISMTGHLHGDIEHVHIHLKLGFDLKQNLVFMDTIDFAHTGDIKVWVSGNAAIDWISNAMTAVISGILHNLILDIVGHIVADPINSLIDGINSFLHPATIF